jgi:hypothetical protein
MEEGMIRAQVMAAHLSHAEIFSLLADAVSDPLLAPVLAAGPTRARR